MTSVSHKKHKTGSSGFFSLVRFFAQMLASEAETFIY